MKSCGGLTEYPAYDHDEIGKPMPLEEFHTIHEEFLGDVAWDELLSTYQRLGVNKANPNPYDSNKILIQVKQFLAASDPKKKENTLGLVTFASFLPYKFCSVGACGRYHQSDDTWVITDAMKNIDPEKDLSSLGGHEMIIIGYDDNAVAIDKDERMFPSDEAAFKQIYLALQNISKKWTMPIRDWKPALARFMIEFEGRV